ncbi:MAG: GGDEF domain-containing protein [Pseudomonadales bacterium]
MSIGNTRKTANSGGALVQQPAAESYAPLDVEYKDRRLQLTHNLGTSLDTAKLLSLFHGEMNDLLNTAGIHFVNHDAGLDIAIAKRAVHSCQYQLKLEREDLGSIVFSRATRFHEKELALLEYFMTHLLYPLRNALLYHKALRMAERDPLTGMRNRVAMVNSLKREIALGKRHQDFLSLLVIDIDNFKLVNDNYGHIAGDQILRQVAETIMETVRQTDMSFRYGGEEFVVVLSKTNLEGAIVIGDRLRQLVENNAVTYKEQELRVTISVGATQLTAEDDLNAFFDRADRALYAAKNNGRNRVESAA